MGRRAYFFTLDAFIAMGIVVVGLFLILTSYAYRPITSQGTVSSGDIILNLAATEVTEINSDYVYLLIRNGTITNRKNSLLQQAAEFYVNRQESMGSKFLNATTYNLVPMQYGYNISINRTTMHHRGEMLPSSTVVVATRTVVFGVFNDTMWGPIPAEVRVWR